MVIHILFCVSTTFVIHSPGFFKDSLSEAMASSLVNTREKYVNNWLKILQQKYQTYRFSTATCLQHLLSRCHILNCNLKSHILQPVEKERVGERRACIFLKKGLWPLVVQLSKTGDEQADQNPSFLKSPWRLCFIQWQTIMRLGLVPLTAFVSRKNKRSGKR